MRVIHSKGVKDWIARKICTELEIEILWSSVSM